MNKTNYKTNGGKAGKILKRLTANKKKGGVALGLVTVMVVMWLRIITHNQPSTAQAAPEATGPENKPVAIKVVFRDLPIVPGRNDLIARDFFSPQGWKSFSKYGEGQGSNKVQEVTSIFANRDDAIIQVVQKLKLDAIVLSEHPQAFIADKLLSIGDSLTIKDGGKTYKFEVIGIFENTVLLKHDATEITLKLTQNDEKNN